MWLLNTQTQELEEFPGAQVPPYSILSHTWGAEEVTFAEMRKAKYREATRRKLGFAKIQGCCKQAKNDGFVYVWVDSCCIDKRSSAELSEAINSMFQWYKNAQRCYVYLSDVTLGDNVLKMIADSQWFTRGWTLQELLAPRVLWFFAQDWSLIGYKATMPSEDDKHGHAISGTSQDSVEEAQLDLVDLISRTTDIPRDFLVGKTMIAQACIAQRMYWAARRQTTRAEDRAYSLMGLFDINMPILYGEGLEKAFARLQREIIARSPDQSIFAWYQTYTSSHRLLAESPDCFQNSRAVAQMNRSQSLTRDTSTNWSAFSTTNLGLEITLPLSLAKIGGQLQWGDSAKAALYCIVDEPGKQPQQIFLNLVFLNYDISGRPVFMCHRNRKWNVGASRGYPTSIFLSSNDYISALSGQKVIKQPEVEPVRNLVDAFVHILADELLVDSSTLSDDLAVESLGIDSLLVLQLVSRIREELKIDISTFTVIKSRTLGELKQHIASCGG